jgi:hypothetical protein
MSVPSQRAVNVDVRLGSEGRNRLARILSARQRSDAAEFHLDLCLELSVNPDCISRFAAALLELDRSV